MTGRREDTSTSTVDAAAAHARLLADDDAHPLDCRCRGCVVDELSPEDLQVSRRPSLFELEQLAVEEALAHEGACCDRDDLAAAGLAVHSRCGLPYVAGALPEHLELECPQAAEVDVQRFLDWLEQRRPS